MSKKGKLSVRFQRLLPAIYPKIIIEGYTHKDCSEWLEQEYGLKMPQNLFTTYMNRYGNLKEEIERYEEYISANGESWWPDNKEASSSQKQGYVFGSSMSKANKVEPNNKSTSREARKEAVSRQGAVSATKVSQSTILGLGPEPTDNKFQDMPNPLDTLAKERRERLTKKSK